MQMKWTPQAATDLQEVYTYIAKDSRQAAQQQIRVIVNGIRSLRDHPHIGRSGRVSRTRELIIMGTSYIVAYAISQDELHILAVLHTKRRWPKRFFP